MVLHVLLGVGQARPHAPDVALHLLSGRGCAVLERARLLADARPLVGEADGVAAVEDGDGGLDEVRVHEVLDNLADDGERDAPALLLGEAGDRCGDFLEVGADVLGLHHHDAGRCRRVVEDGDAGRVAHDGAEDVDLGVGGRFGPRAGVRGAGRWLWCGHWVAYLAVLRRGVLRGHGAWRGRRLRVCHVALLPGSRRGQPGYVCRPLPDEGIERVCHLPPHFLVPFPATDFRHLSIT